MKTLQGRLVSGRRALAVLSAMCAFRRFAETHDHKLAAFLPLYGVTVLAVSIIGAAMPSAALGETKQVSGVYTLTGNEDWTAYDSVEFVRGATVALNGHTLSIGKFGCSAATNDIAAGYAGLTHFDTDGGQYVSLGGNGNDYEPASDDRVEMCVRLQPSGLQFLFGSRIDALKDAFNLLINGAECRIDYASGQTPFGQSLNADDDYTIVMDGKNQEFSVLSDGVLVKPAVAMTGESFTPVKPFCLFSLNSNGSASSSRARVRFYWFRVYGSDGALKCHAVPAYDKANDAIGVYDLVSGNFYGNSGTGAFAAKGEARIINTVEGYSRLSYLDTDGSSYAVLADYQPAADDRVEMTAKILNTGKFLFGSRQEPLVRAFNLYLNNNKPRIDYSDKQPNFESALNTTDDYVIVMDGNNRTFSVGYPDGLAFGSSVVIPDSVPFTPVAPFYLFTVNTAGAASGAMAKVRFYRFRVHGGDGALKCDVVPAKRADGAIGVYDRVAKAFYAKAGSGNFTAVGAVESALSDLVDPAEVRVNVAVGATVANDCIKLEGNVKLVKEGKGDFVAAKAGQTYTGGTLVADGKLLCGGRGSDNILGPDGAVVTVSADGTLEMNGKTHFANYHFVLDGGRIVNSVDTQTGNDLNRCPLVASLALMADSTFAPNIDYGMIRLTGGNSGEYGYDDATASLDLGGHTLTVDTSNDHGFVMRGLVTSGGETGTLSVTGIANFSFYPPMSDLSNATLVMGGETKLRVVASDSAAPTVKDYIVNTTGADDRSGLYGPVFVNGTFQPNTDRFYGTKLKTGATLDLSGRTSPLDARSANNVSSGANARNIQFEDGATIHVKLGSAPIRNPIFKWANAADKPSNWDGLTFVWSDDSARTGRLVKKDDGLYVICGFIIMFK